MNNNGTSTHILFCGTGLWEEVGRLRGMMLSEKRKQIIFFNSEDGKPLLLEVNSHSGTFKTLPRCSEYFEGNKNDEKSTGSQSSQKSQTCSVTLCMTN